MTIAILDFDRARLKAIATPQNAPTGVARLVALDRIRDDKRRRLTCRWRRDAEGRLVAIWEPDFIPGDR